MKERNTERGQRKKERSKEVKGGRKKERKRESQK